MCDRSGGGRSTLAWALAVLVVVSSLASPAAAVLVGPGHGHGLGSVTGSAGTDRPDARGVDGQVRQVDTETNNSSVRHENPETAGESGDLAAVRGYLTRSLVERLRGSSLQLSQEQYQAARSVLGDDYDESLAKFVDVAGGTEGERAAESLGRAQESQRRLVEDVREFRETQSEYEEARAAGNEARARELARELTRIADDVGEASDSTVESYTVVENATGADLASAKDRTRNVSRQIQAEADEIAAAELEATTLEASLSRQSASFTDPVTVSGRLTTENGTALGGQVIRVRVAERTVQTTTDENGEFSVPYRPVLARTGEVSVAVEYVPGGDSPYLTTSESLALEIRETRANLTLTSAPEMARFDSSVRVEGRLRVNGTPVPSVPVRVTLGGVSLGTVQTTPEGTFSLRARVPADVPAGSQSLTAGVAVEGRAVTAAPATDSVAVSSTPTTLSVDADAADGSLVVEGVLQTANGGTPAPGRTVELRVDGRTVQTVTTNADGAYRARLSIPEGVAVGDDVTIEAEFSGAGTNLEPSLASTTATVEVVQPANENENENGGGDSDGEQSLQSSLPVVAVLSVLVGLSLVGGGWYYFRETTAPTVDDDATTSSTTPEETSRRVPGEDVLAVAREKVGGDRADFDAAVELAYEAARRALTARMDASGALTHWEFFERARESGVVDDVDAFRTLTERFERASYAPTRSSDEDATSAFDVAERVVFGEDGGAGASRPSDD